MPDPNMTEEHFYFWQSHRKEERGRGRRGREECRVERGERGKGERSGEERVIEEWRG